MYEPTYKQQFQKAITRSDKMGCSSANDFEPLIRPGTQVSHYLSVTKHFMENARPPARLHHMCGEIHFALWEALQSCELPSFVTIGDVICDKDNLFGTTLDTLSAEWSGKYHGTTTDTKLHVWLTLPDMETVIDVTLLPYLLRGLPDSSDWKKYLYVSGMTSSNHKRIEHVPMLIGITFLFQSGAVPMPYRRV